MARNSRNSLLGFCITPKISNQLWELALGIGFGKALGIQELPRPSVCFLTRLAIENLSQELPRSEPARLECETLGQEKREFLVYPRTFFVSESEPKLQREQWRGLLGAVLPLLAKPLFLWYCFLLPFWWRLFKLFSLPCSHGQICAHHAKRSMNAVQLVSWLARQAMT